MMRTWTLIGLLLLANLSITYGQATNPGLMDAILLFEKGEYYQSVHDIAFLLQQNELNEADLPKAHFFLGQSYLGLIRTNPKFRKKNPYAVARAFTHTETAHLLGHEGRYTDLANSAFETLQPYLYNEGVFYFNKEMYVASDYFFDKATSINPEDYEALLARCFVALESSDTTRAIALLESLMQGHDATKEDSLPPAIREGQALLASYSGKTSGNNVALKKGNQLLEPFPKVIFLEAQELKVYQDQPLKQKEAVRLFEDVLRRFPEDTQTALAYAELLQYMGKKDTATVLYKQVLKADPQQLKAHKGLAIYQLNKAISIHESLQKEEVSSIRKAQEESINDCLRKAWPHFEQLHKAEPEERRWLEQLAWIAKRLNRSDADHYSEKLKTTASPSGGKQ